MADLVRNYLINVATDEKQWLIYQKREFWINLNCKSIFLLKENSWLYKIHNFKRTLILPSWRRFAFKVWALCLYIFSLTPNAILLVQSKIVCLCLEYSTRCCRWQIKMIYYPFYTTIIKMVLLLLINTFSPRNLLMP